jgi:hypothetical protein
MLSHDHPSTGQLHASLSFLRTQQELLPYVYINIQRTRHWNSDVDLYPHTSTTNVYYAHLLIDTEHVEVYRH